MRKNQTTLFRCQSCGYQSQKWLGKCPDCGGWSTLVEEQVAPAPSRPNGRPGFRTDTSPVKISDITENVEERLHTGIGELDRVLGGGIVPGSLVLVGGDPGIGKSTLLLQACGRIGNEHVILYVSGEESPRQIRMRANRLGCLPENLYLFPETNLENILPKIEALNPSVVVVDSVQTLYTDLLQSAPGSIGQVRETAAQLMVVGKKLGIPIILVGHVTKDGTIAGPRVLEHIVDTVLYFEGERGHAFRVLRAVKNRFGSTNEIGLFEMRGDGLSEVTNPSELFLSDRQSGISGGVVTPAMEGTRPLLVEVQALVSPSNFQLPRRTCTGVDYNRTSLLLAILEKRGGLNLAGEDVFVNVAGGVKIDETAIDLAVIAAVASSFRDKPVDPKTIVFGEVGLGGEVRSVPQVETRLKEAQKIGFRRCLLPPSKNLADLRGPDMELVPIGRVDDLLYTLFQ